VSREELLYTRLQPILNIADLEAEIGFYTALEFEIKDQAEGFAAVAFGDCILFGLQQQKSPAPEVIQESMVWQIGVTDVGLIQDLCQRQDLNILRSPERQPWGEWIMKVESPNGWVVVFEGPINKSS
jgi:hypothetical protein